MPIQVLKAALTRFAIRPEDAIRASIPVHGQPEPFTKNSHMPHHHL